MFSGITFGFAVKFTAICLGLFSIPFWLPKLEPVLEKIVEKMRG